MLLKAFIFAFDVSMYHNKKNMNSFNKILILVVSLIAHTRAQKHFKVIQNAYHWNNKSLFRSIQPSTSPITCLAQCAKVSLPYIVVVEKLLEQNYNLYSCSAYSLELNSPSITTQAQNSTVYLLFYLGNKHFYG